MKLSALVAIFIIFLVFMAWVMIERVARRIRGTTPKDCMGRGFGGCCCGRLAECSDTDTDAASHKIEEQSQENVL